MNDLAVYNADPQERARRLAGMPQDELRRHAVRLANAHSLDGLWEMTQAYLLMQGKTSPHTLRNRREGVVRWVEYAKEHGVNLLRPGRNDGRGWLRALETEGFKPLTVRSRLSAARVLYRALHWAGATEADPFRDVKSPKDPQPAWDKRDAYTQDEVEKLLAVTDDPRTRALLLLLAHGGLRAAEAVALQWQDIRLDRGQLTVREGKGGKTRRVNLTRPLKDALAALQSERGTEGEVMGFDRTNAYRRLQRIAQRAGVEYKGLHSLRHHCGTRLAEQTGGDLLTVARHLGHAQLDTSRIYVHMNDNRVRCALESW